MARTSELDQAITRVRGEIANLERVLAYLTDSKRADTTGERPKRTRKAKAAKVPEPAAKASGF